MMNKEDMNNGVTVGLIRGRHPLPVDNYIFNSDIEDVFDYAEMAYTITDFIRDKVGIYTGDGCGYNQTDDVDVQIFKGVQPLTVYITGLTSVTVELVRTCLLYGVDLTLMHFNKETNEYVPQHVC